MIGTISLISAAQNGNNTAYEELISKNSALIWSIVRRFSGKSNETDDLYQLGCMGFVKAIQGFDATLGYQFSTYAVPKIAGEIRRFLRDDGMIKVSRSIKEQSYKLSKIRNDLQQMHGRDPTLRELSDASGLTVEEIAEIDCACTATDSLNREMSEDGGTLAEVLGTVGIEETILERVSLLDAIKQLTKREQIVISARYFRAMTQDKTAKLLGTSQVQVSRIERKAIKKLRELL